MLPNAPHLLILLLGTISMMKVHGKGCEMSAHVNKVYPPDVYMGYGNAGLYRTEGVSLTIVCTCDTQCQEALGGSGHIELIDKDDTRIEHAEFPQSMMLTHEVMDLTPWYTYRCKCLAPKITIKSAASVTIPTIVPCSTDVCTKSDSQVCYQEGSNAIQRWIPDALNCGTTEKLTANLQTFKWNDGVEDEIASLTGKYNVAPQEVSSLLDTSKVTKICAKNVLNTFCAPQQTGFCKTTCELLTAIETDETQLPNFRSLLGCQRIEGTASKAKIYLDFFPLFLLHKEEHMPIYIGSVYYIQQQQGTPTAFQTSCSSAPLAVSNNQQIQCTLYTWKQGTSVSHAVAIPLTSFSEDKPSCLYQWWYIHATLLATDDDDIQMIGCTLSNPDGEYVTPITLLPVYRQVEFFVRHLPTVLQYPADKNQCMVTVRNEEIAGHLWQNSDGDCVCNLTLITCNPVKTVQDIMEKVDASFCSHMMTVAVSSSSTLRSSSTDSTTQTTQGSSTVATTTEVPTSTQRQTTSQLEMKTTEKITSSPSKTSLKILSTTMGNKKQQQRKPLEKDPKSFTAGRYLLHGVDELKTGLTDDDRMFETDTSMSTTHELPPSKSRSVQADMSDDVDVMKDMSSSTSPPLSPDNVVRSLDSADERL